jgi:hypothetical protein
MGDVSWGELISANQNAGSGLYPVRTNMRKEQADLG